jgi:hypothetical protein
MERVTELINKHIPSGQQHRDGRRGRTRYRQNNSCLPPQGQRV